MINPFQWHLSHQGYVVIDGALATELQNRGCDLNDPLWSAKILIDEPHLIGNIHYDYFVAGADCAITASYQATPLGFAQRGLSTAQSVALIKKSVALAQHAKDRYLNSIDNKRHLVIAGSVGPYGAYLADGSEYTGSYHLAHRDMMHFHYDRIKALIEAGVDILACETIPSFAETQALIELIKQFPAMPCWFSFTLKDSENLSDGTPLTKVMMLLNSEKQVISVGVNCIALTEVTNALRSFNQLTNKPLIVYPNSGEQYDANSKTWIASAHDHNLCHQLSVWQKNGAQLIGGCCRTTPSDIKEITKRLSQ